MPVPHASRRTVFGGLLALPVAAGAALPAAAQVPAGQRITFLHVNDIYLHGPRNGRGGLAELQTLIARVRAAAPGPVIFTFGGDLFSPSLASSITHGRHMVELFNVLAPAAAVLGNHEFDFGPEEAEKNIRASRFPWLGANVLGADGRPFGGAVATATHDVEGGPKIGFVGVLTPATAQMSNAAGITFTPPDAALRTGAAQLRAQGAELVVALTHLDIADDRRIAREVPGIDLILGGHDHDPMSLLDEGPLVLKAGQDALWLGVVEMELARRPGERATVASLGWRFVPNVNTPAEPRLAAAVGAIDAELDRSLARSIAQLTAPLDSRTAVVRAREAAIGNLVADALRAHFNADAALINGGGLRGNREYRTGHDFTRRDLLTEMPFGNVGMLLELTGAELLGVLEHGLSAVELGAGRFPQVSGIALTYDPAAPAGSRLREVQVGGASLDPARRYRLATVDFLARGGDGYAGLRGARVLIDAAAGPLLVNVVAEAIERAGAVTARVEGRLRP
ncbi:bifunctional metallophosphatase/5'-nucleotidase [Roseomonas hellenica]|uniref:Bifunctional metallophosphatase/5'-nucleotidase n=1 Tax=Plastoroseomonas hellenica TaxID=2687306 RepID=A0ABS5ETB3_9PROT|nr:bifunctional UDP-sugar hydrolase/5'-nucleotidase [Plastoroseomonas hellenica]MBR0663522.1 bifunctional metallophosphatase/5'-nucleotidase [Plastoroseomonas hellenica]